MVVGQAVLQKKQEVELKGGMYTLLSLRLHSTNLEAIDAGLADKVKQAPGFFSNTPVVIDMTRIEDHADLNAEELIRRVRAHKLMPVLVNVSDRECATNWNLSLPIIETTTRDVSMDSAAARKKTAASKPESSKESSLLMHPASAAANKSLKKKEAQPALADGDDESGDDEPDADDSGASEIAALQKELNASKPQKPVLPLLINRPIRSGQQQYARETDLIIMAHVGPGAEIVADNNIHVYGPLRGRALCGVTGNSDSRIFCQSLEAELVSVAGVYKVLEEIPEQLFGKPAQIWLKDGQLNIDPL